MQAIRVENLCKSYRVRAPRASAGSRRVEKTVLDDICFDVDEGEVLGVIGGNGAGKSTLLKILSRITSPTRGRAIVTGRVASLLEVGTGMHPEMTGRENIYLNGALLGMPRPSIAARFDDIVDFAGVHDYIEVPIKHYSTGMKLRLAFAVAAHLSADIMIVDEVLAVGDAAFQAKCLGVLQDGVRTGRTTLFVSHNMAAIESLCSRVIWLNGGKIARAGKPDEVVRDYLSKMVTTGASHVVFKDCARHREHTGVCILGATVSGPDGGPVQQGDDLRIEVDLAAYEPVRGLQLSAAISTLEGHPVCVTSNGDCRNEWDVGPGRFKATIHLTDVRLLPRTHKISLRAGLDWGREVFEDLPDAVTFDVLGRDVLGSGIAILADRGVTWMPATYELTTAAGEFATAGRTPVER